MTKYNPDKCIACTMCLVACPVAKASSKFLGPRTIGPGHERFRLFGVEEDESLTLCSNCKNCDMACPHGVPVSSLNIMAKAELYKSLSPSLAERMLANGEGLARSSAFVPAFIKNFFTKNKMARAVLGLVGISPKATMPSFAKKTFREQFKKVKQPAASRGQVVFFPGCYMDIYDADASMHMLSVLNTLGYEVVLPSTMCCGLPMLANGLLEKARDNAKANVESLSPYLKDKTPILTGCPSCALMFKEDIPELFPDLELFGSGVQDLQEFVFEALRKHPQPMRLREKLRVVYHAPCHLRAQGIGLPGLEVLQGIENLEVVNAGASCCGISGSYGFKKVTYDISMKIGAELFATMKNSGAALGVSECGTCRLQMTHGSGLQSVHPMKLVLQALIEAKA